MPTTDEELAQLQETAEAKRQEVSDARSARETRERQLANDITAAQLSSEIDRLDRVLDDERARSTEEAVLAGASAALDPDAARREAEAAHEAMVAGGGTTTTDQAVAASTDEGSKA